MSSVGDPEDSESWQEESCISFEEEAMHPQDPQDLQKSWYPREWPLSPDFTARSVSPHEAWRAEVSWKTYVKNEPEEDDSSWYGSHGLNHDTPGSERRRKRVGAGSGTKPSASPLAPVVPEESDEKVITDRPTIAWFPAEDICEACPRGWLADCIANRCKAESSRTWLNRWGYDYDPVNDDHRRPAQMDPKLPKRLLDLESGACGPGEVALIETQSFRNDYVYSTLSYCWGEEAQRATWLTTKANLHARSRGFARSSLPQTLQDALVISEALEIRYMWIDALCIVQDDTEDWEFEGSRMAGIYIGSLVTILAASSSSSRDGIFRSLSPERCTLPSPDGIWNDARCDRRCIHNTGFPTWGPLIHVKAGPLSRRAWAFQERALSPRKLYYTACQLIWECEHCRKPEDGIDRGLT
ncbi:het domain containing protein [Apiospora rasikravindrae]|uniref:Het domain containing protein n=1 Tax=Apiospora rasikravindrae TaxID=990691 RepID=A0ABR1THS4_9PEZI